MVQSAELALRACLDNSFHPDGDIPLSDLGEGIEKEGRKACRLSLRNPAFVQHHVVSPFLRIAESHVGIC